MEVPSPKWWSPRLGGLLCRWTRSPAFTASKQAYSFSDGRDIYQWNACWVCLEFTFSKNKSFLLIRSSFCWHSRHQSVLLGDCKSLDCNVPWRRPLSPPREAMDLRGDVGRVQLMLSSPVLPVMFRLDVFSFFLLEFAKWAALNLVYPLLSHPVCTNAPLRGSSTLVERIRKRVDKSRKGLSWFIGHHESFGIQH